MAASSSSSTVLLSTALLSSSPTLKRSLDSQQLLPSVAPTRKPPRCQTARARFVDRRPAGRRSLARELDHAVAVDEPRSVPVRVAHELLLAGHRYLDVRTEEEFSVGHAEGAVNVPYMVKFGSGMAKNPCFVEEVLQIFWKDAEIIVGCESGKRSLMAATELGCAGFTGITDIAGGYAAWMQSGLPME